LIYWYDCEFDEYSKEEVKLISIGIVSEDHREYYAECIFNEEICSPWVKQHVLPRLGKAKNRKTKDEIRTELEDFFDEDEAICLVAYKGGHDHVLLTRLFGSMSELHILPHYTWDIKQKVDELRYEGEEVKLPRNKKKHHALADARWARIASLYMIENHGVNIPVIKLNKN
jgi:hypothetical protein